MSGGSFGSRNDMISSKFNAIAKNKIWREILERERKQAPTHGKFNVNPKKLLTLTAKCHHINPMELQKEVEMDPDSREETDEARELREKMEESLRPPQEKSKWPMTSNQTLGWMWQEGQDNYNQNKRWNQSLSSCEETRYAKAYVMMSGKSPYASK
jgi:hypothetical protein